ncbi:unnamed protein product [Caenorhabditis bovis]|uniref:Uncharacterized protein n=1 Tax=Caenorhabditis bovis TaxID=2654633 RepID=A0A8S1EDV9_9PELO|nr:unnamed protein product [Caenorhabditis bovis]
MGSLCDQSVVDNQFCAPDCPKNKTCIKSNDGTYSCEGNECAPDTCKNNGTCISEKGDLKCVCLSGFTGKACETDVNECEPNRCLNGGSCENSYGSYKCHCADGFDGKNCENSLSLDCAPNYCNNGGSCNVVGGKFTCECPDGYEGEQCQTSVENRDCICDNPNHICQKINGSQICDCPDRLTGDKCDEKVSKPCDMEPCLNGGHCVDDGANLFTCFCLPHWTGVYCGEPVECLVNGRECENGGTCVWSLAMTTCECPTNFTGDNCEKPVSFKSHPTCNDIKCQNGGKCLLDVSGEPYCECPMDFEPPFCEPKSACMLNPCKNDGTCQDVDGQFYCHCSPGFTGLQCESLAEIPTESSTSFPTLSTGFTESSLTCDECVYSTKCVELEQTAICLCEEGYTGMKCDRKQYECLSLQCSGNYVCQTNGSKNATCVCPIGTYGENCAQVSSATFSSSSIFIHHSSKLSLGSSNDEDSSYSLEFSFRTTVGDTHLASSENILGEKILSISLVSGRLHINTTSELLNNIVPIDLNDAHWYTLTVHCENDEMEIKLFSSDGTLIYSKKSFFNFEVFLTRFGKISNSDHFIGCLADVRIDNELVIFTESKKAIDIRKGCSRNEQCSRDYCQNGGICVDNWENSSCKCEPPYLKPNCAFALPEITFGHTGTPSIVRLSTSESEGHLLHDEIALSFLMATRKSDAFLFYIGEKQNKADGATNYCTVHLRDGKIIVKARNGGRKEIQISSKNRIDDNKVHYVQIILNRKKRQIFLDKLLEYSEDFNNRIYQEFISEEILIGSMNSSAEDYFKGFLQDIQLNGKSIIIQKTNQAIDSIGSVESTSNIMRGAVSDPICRDSLCKNGQCVETFNDYYCECSEGFTGTNCDKTDYCLSAKCLPGGQCQNTDTSYYCSYPVTISEKSKIRYQLVTPNVEEISFAIRTHSENGYIFTFSNGNDEMKVMIVRKYLVVFNKSGAQFNKTISDGKWHQIHIRPFKLTIDDQSFVSHTELITVKNGNSTLFVGDHSEDSLHACLDNFKIGNMPRLPFTKQSNNHAILMEKENVGTGCVSSEQCGLFSTCLNGATCVDLWNRRKCICADGFTGENCEVNINECKYIDCGNHGYCTDGIDGATCNCNEGYSGSFCEILTDPCEGIICHNGGKCEKHNENVACKCEDNWMGEFCNVTATTRCEDSPCRNSGKCIQSNDKNFICVCEDGFSGTLCEKKLKNDCDHHVCNNGHCVITISGPACQCDFGYSGRFCEKLLNSCTAKTCSSRGSCTSVWNGTICDCEKNWRGPHCQYPPNICTEFPCENDGVCSLNDDNTFRCHCQKYYLGDKCEHEGSCLRAKCVHGECIQHTPEKHTCSCNVGYEGDTCNKRIDYCKSSPCMNNGSCENMLTGFKCNCPIGFVGENCQIDIDECAFGFCGNGAKCRDRVNDYDCICDGTGYEGKNCTIDINECSDPRNCINGVCTNMPGSYKCSCNSGYIGDRCSMEDPCQKFTNTNISAAKCVHGKCVNPSVIITNNKEVAKYECVCDRGYTGPVCSSRIKEKSMTNIGYLFGPIVAIGIVLIILGCLLLIFVIRGNNAMHGHYSPSSHEFTQSRMPMPTVIKLPPQERLI